MYILIGHPHWHFFLFSYLPPYQSIYVQKLEHIVLVLACFLLFLILFALKNMSPFFLLVFFKKYSFLLPNRNTIAHEGFIIFAIYLTAPRVLVDSKIILTLLLLFMRFLRCSQIRTQKRKRIILLQYNTICRTSMFICY